MDKSVDIIYYYLQTLGHTLKIEPIRGLRVSVAVMFCNLWSLLKSLTVDFHISHTYKQLTKHWYKKGLFHLFRYSSRVVQIKISIILLCVKNSVYYKSILFLQQLPQKMQLNKNWCNYLWTTMIKNIKYLNISCLCVGTNLVLFVYNKTIKKLLKNFESKH